MKTVIYWLYGNGRKGETTELFGFLIPESSYLLKEIKSHMVLLILFMKLQISVSKEPIFVGLSIYIRQN